MTLQPRLKFGMIGGGLGSFVGGIHRHAATVDGKAELVAGAFASTPERAIAAGDQFGLRSDRNYGSWQEMLATESRRPAADRLDFVCIVTPNHVHFEPTLAFIEAGFNVIVDKPLVHTSVQAQALIAAAERHDVLGGVTYNYTGYPLVKEARDWVRSGKLGTLRRVVVEYPQGWLSEPLERQGNRQAEWRTDPVRTGLAGAIGDIGTHAENLAAYITGLSLESLCADVTTAVAGRLVDDDASILLRYAHNVRGVLWVSQVATGEGNGLNIRVYGTAGHLQWNQEQANYLRFSPAEGAVQIFQRGQAGLSVAAQRATRLPSGLQEAYLEAFANIYLNYCDTVIARREGRDPTALELDFPTLVDGARGVKFIEKAIESGKAEQKWIAFD